jgi:flagellar protein FliJ
MKKFVYKFETIKKLKKTFEKQAQKEVAEVDLEIEKWVVKRNKIAEEAKKAREEFLSDVATVSDVTFKKNHQMVLKRMIEDVDEKINALKKTREKKMEQLVERTREHKIFETLEERHHQQYIKEQNKIEMSQIDEYATQKYVRSEK